MKPSRSSQLRKEGLALLGDSCETPVGLGNGTLAMCQGSFPRLCLQSLEVLPAERDVLV